MGLSALRAPRWGHEAVGVICRWAKARRPKRTRKKAAAAEGVAEAEAAAAAAVAADAAAAAADPAADDSAEAMAPCTGRVIIAQNSLPGNKQNIKVENAKCNLKCSGRFRRLEGLGVPGTIGNVYSYAHAQNGAHL